MSKSSLAVIKWRKKTKQKIIESMGKCCQLCGYFKCDAALEIHHLDPSIKEISFGAIRANPISAEKIKNELINCILLCANCHREVHNNAASLPETYASFNPDIFDSIFREKKERREIFKKEKIWNQKIFITTEELLEKLKTEFQGNQSAIAKHFNVSEAAIRKRIKKYYSGVVK